jgi:hypothetical protein
MKKRNIFLVLLFVIKVYSQEKTTNDYKILIDSSIVIKANDYYKFYNEQLAKDIHTENWKYYIEKLKKSINSIYIIDQDGRSIGLNSIKTQIPLKTLDVYDKKNKILLKKGVAIWKVIPVLKGDVLTITIIDANMYYKNKRYNFINGGGSTIIFQYSCEEKKWVLIKEEHTGI